MFVFYSLFLEVAYLGLCISGVLMAWTLFVARWRMKRNASLIKRVGASSGSMVKHGMVYD